MPMKLYVDRIAETPCAEVFEASAAWWIARVGESAGLAEAEFESFEIRLHSHRIASKLYLEGEISGSAVLECSRCTARYRQALRDDYRLILEEAGDRIPPDPEGVENLAREGVFLTDEIESGWYRGSEIQLDGLFAEVISLAIPIQPLCGEDCEGVCLVCGVRRSEQACGCETDEEREAREKKERSPFARLAELQLGEGEGD